VNLAFHHDVGLLVEGFELPPSMMMPYNPRTYAQLLEANGFVHWKDLFSYELTQNSSMPEKFVQIAERARKNFTLRRLDLGDADGEARRIREVYDAFVQPGWGLAPLSQAEMELSVQRLRPLVFLRPELSFIAEVNSEPVGFALTVPESNVALKAAGGFLSRFGLPIGAAKFLWSVRTVKRLRVLLFGIKPGFRRRGLDALLAWETFKTAQKYGYTSAELGWVKEDDSLMNRMIQSTGARRIKTYRLYQRPI
jgi:GNAT superfamily N-acetyltransferase